MFNIDITAEHILIKQLESRIILTNADLTKILTSDHNRVDLSQEITFFRRESGNITFLFYRINEYGHRIPCLSRIDISKDIWHDIINKRTFLDAPVINQGICISCGAESDMTVHHHCVKYTRTLQLFLLTPDGKACLFIFTKMLAYIYGSTKTFHIKNKSLDILMHLNLDIKHDVFKPIYDNWIRRKNHPFALEINFNYFIKTCGPLICETTLLALNY